MLVGTNRANAQGVLDALSRQSCADDVLEIVVFDCANESVPALKAEPVCLFKSRQTSELC